MSALRHRMCVQFVVLLAASCWSLAVVAQEWDPKPNRDVDEGANKKFRPIVFVHGGSGAGEQFERRAKHLTGNGYPPTWVVAFDYSTGGGAGGGGGARGAAPGARGAGEAAGGAVARGGRGALGSRGAIGARGGAGADAAGR